MILLLFLSIPDQNSRIVINTGIADAEFYLDANYVAATDRNGSLIIENFPAGSFSFSIMKKGYKTYRGTFTIGEGESKLLQPVLEKNKSIEKQDQPAPVGAPGDKKAGVPSEKAVSKSLTGPIPSAATGSVKHSPMRIPQDEPQGPSTLPALILLCAISSTAIGIWIWKRKREVPEIQPIEAAAEQDAQELQEHIEDHINVANRPEPPFIEELKRKEELLKAGFVESKPRTSNQEPMKEKEVVIVLPKEAFRYEDDK
jgi:hypothetical protein